MDLGLVHYGSRQSLNQLTLNWSMETTEMIRVGALIVLGIGVIIALIRGAKGLAEVNKEMEIGMYYDFYYRHYKKLDEEEKKREAEEKAKGGKDVGSDTWYYSFGLNALSTIWLSLKILRQRRLITKGRSPWKGIGLNF